MIHSRTVVLDQKMHVRLVLDTEIKGCGRRASGLTFYLLREEETIPGAKIGHLARGQRAETTTGRRGVLLCQQCAGSYGLGTET